MCRLLYFTILVNTRKRHWVKYLTIFVNDYWLTLYMKAVELSLCIVAEVLLEKQHQTQDDISNSKLDSILCQYYFN